MFFILIAGSCSKKHTPAGPSLALGYSPTFTRTIAVTLTATITRTNTAVVTPTYTSTVTPTLGCQNTGKIASSIMQILYPSVITMTSLYCYAPDGKITGQDINVSGMGDFHADTSYTYDGLLEKSVSNAPGGEAKYNVYNAARKLTDYYLVDSTPNTATHLSFSYDGNGRVSRIDQENNGAAASYRLISRDLSGYITREDYYDMSDVTFGYVAFSRNDADKEITIEFYFYGYKVYTLVVDYDASGFWIGTACTAHMAPDVMFYTESNTLQAGLFDTGGMHGYNYTDEDLYPLWLFEGDPVNAFYPGL